MRDAVASFVTHGLSGGRQGVGAVTATAIGRWIEALRAKGLAPGTLQVRFRYLSLVCRGLVASGDLKVDPFAGLRAPRARAPLVAFPNDEELSKLLAPEGYVDPFGVRDLAILTLLATAGLRRAELIGMRWSADPAVLDVDLGLGLGRVLGKGRKQRLVPLLPGVVEVLEVYLREFRPRWARGAEGAFWYGWRGPLTTNAINRIVRERGAAVGLPTLHPHALRHAWANRLLADGVGEGDVMVLGGWTNRAMLSRYGAFAATERAFRAVRSRGAALEPWGDHPAPDPLSSDSPRPSGGRSGRSAAW